MTCCDLCPRPGIARDGDSLLCLACWSARHVVQPTENVRGAA